MLVCKICSYQTEKTLQKHINIVHNMKTKDYYEKFNCSSIDIINDDILKSLGKMTDVKKLAYKKSIGRKFTEEWKENIKKNHWMKKSNYDKTKHPLYGKHLGGYNKGTPMLEYRKQIQSEKMKGRILTEEHKMKISLGVRNSLKYKKYYQSDRFKAYKNRMSKLQKGHVVLQSTRNKISQKNKGRKQSLEEKKRRLKTMSKMLQHRGYKIYKYNGISFRSLWEIEFAKRMDNLDIKWLYEHKVFKFDSYVYMPDFYLPDYNVYVEIKGLWNLKGKEKMQQFVNSGQNLIIINNFKDIGRFSINDIILKRDCKDIKEFLDIKNFFNYKIDMPKIKIVI